MNSLVFVWVFSLLSNKYNIMMFFCFVFSETVYIQSKKGEQLHSVCTILGFQTVSSLLV